MVASIGEKFGMWTVIADAGSDGHKSYRLVRCECGRQATVETTRLTCGRSKRCRGHSPKKHGETAGGGWSPEYMVWAGMVGRCHTPTSSSWGRYGGRGITVCSRWRESFTNFLADMGRKPSPEHSLDRYPDNDGNYEPGNCRWATRKEQCRNRRTTRLLTHNGKTQCIAAWAEETGIQDATIRRRIKHGATAAEALTRTE